MYIIPPSLRRYLEIRKARNILADVSENYKIKGVYHTPDTPEIEAKTGHLVFIYDDMMKDRKDFVVIKDLISAHAGRAFAQIAVEAYTSVKTGKVIAFLSNKDGVPSWANQTGSQAAPIRGDLYLVPTKSMFALDKLFYNEIYCERIQVDCDRWRYKTYWSQLHNRTHVTKLGSNTYKAWIYLGIPEMWDLDGGYMWKPLQIYKSRNQFKPETYYYHSYRRSPLAR